MPWTDHTGPVPNRTEEEFLALVRQKADAVGTRRRRLLGLATGVLLLLGLTATVVTRGGDEPGTRLETVAGDPTTSTSASPSTTTATVIETAPVPAPAPASTTAGTRPTSSTLAGFTPPRATTPTTARPPAPATTVAATTTSLVCRNSGEPACGPFRWDPPAGPNRALTVDASVSPSTPRAGDTVTFRVTVDDPDGDQLLSRELGTVDYGDGTPVTGVSGHRDCLQLYGPHTPPDPVPVHEEITFQHVYATPGTYTATFTYRSLGDCARGPSEGARSVIVTVGPR